MPCDTIQTSRVEFKCADMTLLRLALEANGYIVSQFGANVTFHDRLNKVTGSYGDGKFDVRIERGGVFDVDKIKRTFSVKVVESAARRFGWTLTKKKNEENKFVVQRRG